MNQDKDPIADREAKIAAWSRDLAAGVANLLLCTRTHDRAPTSKTKEEMYSAWGYVFKRYDEAVALMRSAPDGDAAAEIDRLRAENERLIGGDSTRCSRITQRIIEAIGSDEPEIAEESVQRLLDKLTLTEQELESADAENARLQADLAAAREELRTVTIDRDIKVENLTNALAAARADQAAMARRELEHLQFDLCCPYPDAYQLVCRRLAALPAQQPNVTVRVLRGPVSEAVVFDDAQQPEPEPEFCGAAVRIVTGGTCANTKPCPTHDAVPVQWMAAGPEPDAATRDGDEVLRELAQWAGGEGTNELWRAVAELCRRELARKP